MMCPRSICGSVSLTAIWGMASSFPSAGATSMCTSTTTEHPSCCRLCSHRLARQERKLQYAYNERYGRLLDDDVPFDPEEWAFTQQMVESDVAIQVLEGLKILQDPEFADPDDEE